MLRDVNDVVGRKSCRSFLAIDRQKTADGTFLHQLIVIAQYCTDFCERVGEALKKLLCLCLECEFFEKDNREDEGHTVQGYRER